MGSEIVKSEGLELAILEVQAKGKRSTELYRENVQAFVNSGHPVTVEGFAEYIEGMKGRQAAATVNLALAAGKRAFVQAGERLGLPARELAIIRDAVNQVKGMRKAPPEVAVVTPAERVKLFAALPVRVRLIAEVLYQTGARVSEIAVLRRDHVKENGHVELRLTGKGSKERQATITAALYRRILDVFQEGNYLFSTRTGAPFHREYISRELARAGKRVLGRSIGAHQLRHSRATDLLHDHSGRIKAVSRLLGHADEAITLKYYVKDSFTPDELAEGV